MPEDRYRVLRASDKAVKERVEQGGIDEYRNMFDIGIGLREAARAIGCSTDKARHVLRELEELEIIRKCEGESDKWCRNI